jgi:hypothetical protein
MSEMTSEMTRGEGIYVRVARGDHDVAAEPAKEAAAAGEGSLRVMDVS